LKPNMGLTLRLMKRWSCSTKLLRYLIRTISIGIGDLPLNFHPAATGVRFYLRCSPTLDRRMLDFSGEEHFANLIRNGPIRPPEKYSY
jgi:hypothetical protein